MRALFFLWLETDPLLFQNVTYLLKKIQDDLSTAVLDSAGI